ncbi:MAG: XkdX family protein [Lacrimispora sp.]
MFETLMRLYDGGKGPLTATGLANVNVVIKGWTTGAQKQEILATKN